MERNKKIFIYTQTAFRETDEVPSRYFYNILKVKQAQASITSITQEGGNIIRDQAEMLNEARAFYENLYKEEEMVSTSEQEFFLHHIKNTLTSEEKELLESEITLQNLENALIQTEAEKSSAYDGIPYEFFFCICLSQRHI